ncbi:endonuclease/exonuclease/phosphatase family protein [Streptomyces synnematoformans]|uniref:Endonuclease/exonuclease/phosphatase family protein n=1 Tax=Streptomyces synnematoformans TaxID=415721 RepID=A0ABN1ZNP7_9ACTN
MPESPLSRRRALGTAAAAALAPGAAGLSAARADSPAHGAGDEDELHVMSFNLRYASATPPHSWPERRPVMRTLLRAEEPHLVGTQEGLYRQLLDIAGDLGRHHAWIGVGRQGGSKDEFMAVFYDIRRLAPVAFDHYWLSDEPYLIGSNTWGNAVLRMVTWVRFRDLVTGGEFYHVNTHLDHVSQEARERSADLITRRFTEFDAALPRVVTGDFNVPAHRNPVYDAMLAGGGLADTWDTAERRSDAYATFHGYRPLVPDGDRIDWILVTPGVRTRYAKINTYERGGQFPSDHLPVQAFLQI